MGRGRSCRSCGVALATGAAGRLCALCARAVGFQRLIPRSFFVSPEMQNALADYDFGTVFKLIRQHTGLSQLQLAGLLDLTQARVSEVESGVRRLTSVKLVARMSDTFGIPAQLLGFYAESPGSLTSKEVTWVDRRDFISLVTAAALGSHLHPELARLGGLLPGHIEPVIRKQIGAADIDAIEAITDGFRHWDLAHGGGLCRTAALTQLHQVRALEGTVCSPHVRTRLWVATADLASMAGWLAYDVEEHDAARKLWTCALQMAHRGEDHPRSTDLTINVLLDIAHQSLHLEQPQEALKFAQLASATATNRRHPVSTITAGYIATVTAWCWAAMDDVAATQRSLGVSQEHYAAADPGTTPSWAWFVTPAEIAGQHGHSLYLLSLTDPVFAGAAVEHLSAAVGRHASEHARSRAAVLPTLASSCLQAGDYESAVRYGHEAITAVTGLSSQRCYARLRDLDQVAAQHDYVPDVAELRADIDAAVLIS
ncbi:helix-turn-helix transcriptional regulator [Nocardia terpenica]|uniref:HTH cro/C1-type domain-containing protein n=2 Tax=Nocardia terpenica TaxID=455432 RepID=A0A291RIN8_9NOCA|nr:hypothetical protein CRH09_14565 [Nocardia terpenica]